MAEKLSVQIALEGGAEIERQLAGIGAAGQKAFAEIEKSASQVGGFKNLKPEEVTAKLKEMGVAGTEAFGKIQQAVQSASRFERVVQGVQAVENAFTSAGEAALALARVAGPVGVAIAAAATLAAKAMNAYTESLDKAAIAAAKLGVSLENAARMRADLAQLGLSSDAITTALEKAAAAADKVDLARIARDAKLLQESAGRLFIDLKFDNSPVVQALKRTEEAAMKADEAGKRARETLVELGLPIPKGAALTLEELVAKTGSAEAGLKAFNAQLASTKSAADQNTMAVKNLGAAGAEMVRSLQAGGAGLEQQMNRIKTTFESESWLQFFQRLGGGFAKLAEEVAAFASQLAGIAWDTISGLGVAAWNALTGAITNATNALLEYLGLKARANPESESGPGIRPSGGGMASGGLMGGRGTGTSDSNLAWLSRGEHIMPARAVRQPGVLSFLEALRRSGGDLSRVLDGMGRFALGGMVPRAIPAYAAGGLAGGGNNVTIQFPGLPAIGGLRASSGVVEQLQKAAALAQVRSGGRKPSRYS